jgi:hypothetical protein
MKVRPSSPRLDEGGTPFHLPERSTGWLKFPRYEIAGGWIRPAAGEPVLFDPLATSAEGHLDSCAVRLLNAVTIVDEEGDRITPDDPLDVEFAIRDFVISFGLFGILHAQAESLGGRPHKVGDRATGWQIRRETGYWNRKMSQHVVPGVRFYPQGSVDAIILKPDEAAKRYFPDGYPRILERPDTPEFMRDYGERLDDWWLHAKRLAGAIRSRNGEILEDYLSTVAPALPFGEKQAARFTDLMGVIAWQYAQCLGSGQELKICGNELCRTFFIAPERRLFCTRRCAQLQSAREYKRRERAKGKADA